jgi:hypothetical protein
MALFAFDGTWNEAKTSEDPQYTNTNVYRFFEAYRQHSGTKDFYVAGVGTRFDLLGRVLGGVFGLGELPRLNEAYAHLCTQWAAGDHVIDIVGFSRGAATTLDFCDIIRERGIREQDSETVVEKTPQIRFLGVWDVVPAFGLANLGLDLNIGHHISLPKSSLKYCFHALALDERRPSFVVTRLPGACEVWFRGVHSDIGGGNENRGLNDITLKWMMEKARAAGLPIAESDIADLQPDPSTAPRLKKELKVPVRHISKVDRKHYTVSPLADCINPPNTCALESEQDEKTASELSAQGIDLFPAPVRAQINLLAQQAEKSAGDHGWTLGESGDAVMALIQNRIPLVQNDADFLRARQSVATLVATMISEAKQHGMTELSPYWLTAALFQFSNLFPFTD